MQQIHEFIPSAANLHSPSSGRLIAKLGAFATHGRTAAQMGLAIFPTAWKDAKKPLVKGWNRTRYSLATIEKLGGKFPLANYGIVCGLSKLVVVDLDTSAGRDRWINLFGDSPLVVRSGRAGGGWHMYYAAPKDVELQTKRLDPFGIEGHVKAGNAFVVGPGSVHPSTGSLYTFERGDWRDTKNLPTFPADDFARVCQTQLYRRDGESQSTAKIKVGERNTALFKSLCARGYAGEFKNENGVISAARKFNQQEAETPQQDREVVATARSVWARIQNGSVRPPGSAAPVASGKTLDAIYTLGKKHLAPLALYIRLKSAHPNGGTFPLSATAMAAAGIVPGHRDRKWYLRAISSLRKVGVIEKVGKSSFGGCNGGRNVAAMYRFCEPQP